MSNNITRAAITSLLRSNNFTIVNNDLMSNIGALEAIVLSKIVSYYEFSVKTESITEEGYFKYSKQDIINQTKSGQKAINTVIKNLIKFGLIEHKNMGLPAVGNFRLSECFEIRVLELLQPTNADLDQSMQKHKLEAAKALTVNSKSINTDMQKHDHITRVNIKDIYNKERETSLTIDDIKNLPTFELKVSKYLSYPNYKELNKVKDIHNVICEDIIDLLIEKKERSVTAALKYVNDYLFNRLIIRYSTKQARSNNQNSKNNHTDTDFTGIKQITLTLPNN